MVVGRLDAVDLGEGPEGRPAFEQVLREQPVIVRFGAFARRLLEQRSQLVLERLDLLDEAGADAVSPVLIPGCEQPLGEGEAGLAEGLLGGEPLAVGGEVADEVGPAELPLFGVEVVVGPPAIRHSSGH